MVPIIFGRCPLDGAHYFLPDPTEVILPVPIRWCPLFFGRVLIYKINGHHLMGTTLWHLMGTTLWHLVGTTPWHSKGHRPAEP